MTSALLVLAQATITIDAGAVDRRGAPVVLEVRALAERNEKPGLKSLARTPPVEGEPARHAYYDGSNLYWLEPGLSAGEKRSFEVWRFADGTKAGGAKFQFKDEGDHRDLVLGDRPVWRHNNLVYDPAAHDATYKQFHHVYTFDGKGFVTKGVGGQYPHHRGLFIGWKAGGGDYWHCKGVSVRHKGFVDEVRFAGPVAARSVSLAEWTAPDGRVAVKERRDVLTWAVGDGRTLMDFAFELASGGGDVQLDGDPQHAGFHFRAVDGAKTTYTRPASAKDKGGDVWTDMPWCVGTFAVEGVPYGVMHMDHPENPGTKEGQTVFSTRPYGRFGPFARHALKEGAPLKFRYRVLVFDPAKGKPDYDALYQDFATPVTVVP